MFTPRRMACANWPIPIDAESPSPDTPIDEIAVGKIGASEHRGHAAVHRVEAMRLTEEVVGRLRRAADAGNLRHPVRLDRELEAGLDDGGGDRVMAATRAQGRNLTLVIAVRVAECVFRQARVVELGLGDVG